MVERGYGSLHKPPLVELIIAQCVKHIVVGKKLLEQSACLAVGAKVSKVRLVGGVHPAVFLDALCLKEGVKCGGKLCEEGAVFFAACGSFPAEKLFAVHVNNFRRVSCAPLCKQVRKLVVFHSAALCRFNPAVKLIKAECIFVLARHGYVNKLHRGSFAAFRSVKRRCKQGRKNHIDAVVFCGFHKVLDNLPILLAEYVNLVPRCKAVAVEPVRAD